MESNQPTTAYILSLIGGLITFITGIVGLVWFGAGGPGWGGFGGWMGGMMSNSHGFTGGGEFGFFGVLSILGLLSGVIMIVGAVMLRMHPSDHLIWGTIILIFAVVSFADMGGYFIGAILGIVGGALAISHQPPRTDNSSDTESAKPTPVTT
jgi:CDP-diglyceride synthetase